MKNLSKSQKNQLVKGINSVISLAENNKKTESENAKALLIQKFGKDNYLSAFDAMQKELIESAKKVDAPKVDALQLDAPKIELDAITEHTDVHVNADMLKALNALGITETLKEKGGKSIFKKDFNNKADRTKCRNAFQNSISLYLLHIAHNKIDNASKELIKIKEIADKYYLAESAFKNSADYCTNNMDENKKGLINMFIELQKVEA